MSWCIAGKTQSICLSVSGCPFQKCDPDVRAGAHCLTIFPGRWQVCGCRASDQVRLSERRQGTSPGRSGVTSPNVCRSLQALTEGFFCFAQRSRWASAIFFLASALSRRRFRPGFDGADCEEAFAVLEPESSWRTLFSVAISSLMEAMMLLTSMVLLYRYQTIKRLGQGSGPALQHTVGTLASFKAASLAALRPGLAESPSVRFFRFLATC